MIWLLQRLELELVEIDGKLSHCFKFAIFNELRAKFPLYSSCTKWNSTSDQGREEVNGIDEDNQHI